MSTSEMIQEDLPGFLEAEAKARESVISRQEKQVYLARQFIRFDKMQKLCSNPETVKLYEHFKQKTLELMRS